VCNDRSRNEKEAERTRQAGYTARQREDMIVNTAVDDEDESDDENECEPEIL
jgi:hypothetical protein